LHQSRRVVSALRLFSIGVVAASAAMLGPSPSFDQGLGPTTLRVDADVYRPVTLVVQAERLADTPSHSRVRVSDHLAEPGSTPDPIRRIPNAWPPPGPIRRAVLVQNGAPVAERSSATTRTTAMQVSDPSKSARHLWPLTIRGTISSRFSATHPGIDIAARSGTPVRAIADGTIAWAGWKTNGGGYVVVIRHSDGMRSTYNHNRGVAVRRGDRVTRGQRIAWVGESGRATGPHLDLRIQMGGRFVDPLALS
jgi:murein DD-endopeptidase MepM/ murein hydrolase activator NlpD